MKVCFIQPYYSFDGKDTERCYRGMVELGCYKVQLYKPYFNEETVKRAHENGILCNVFYADDPEEAKKYVSWGIDTVLTNDFLRIKNALGK